MSYASSGSSSGHMLDRHALPSHAGAGTVPHRMYLQGSSPGDASPTTSTDTAGNPSSLTEGGNSSTTLTESGGGSSSPKTYPRPVVTLRLPSHNDGLESVERDEMSPWAPSIFRIGPGMGLLALTLAVLLTLASFAVLRASDNAPVPSWTYQPTVYLAAFTAISNKAVAFAMIQGTVVTFWLRALRGDSLSALHQDWAVGLHVWKAIIAGRKTTLLALACILTTFVAIDGPLLQRASSVVSAVPPQPVNLTVHISPQVPRYMTGTTILDNFGPGTSKEPFSKGEFLLVSTDWYPAVAYGDNTPITGGIEGCHGSCSTTVTAPAFAIRDCETWSWFRNYSQPLNSEQVEAYVKYDREPTHYQTFFTWAWIHNGTAETMQLKVLRSDEQVSKTGAGMVNETKCSLYSATGEYEINIDDGIISFPTPPSYPKILSIANNTALTNANVEKYGLSRPGGITQTTLSGLASTFMTYFGTREYLMPQTDADVLILGPLVQSWFAMKQITNFPAWIEGTDIAPAWGDATAAIMSGMNEMMFRTGVHAAQIYNDSYLNSLLDEGQQIRYNVSGAHTNAINVFSSDMHFFAAAAAVQGLTISLILLSFWNYWKLGRNVSFSPIELAKAFDAPLLASADSNLSGRRMVKKIGERVVQYGVVYDYDSPEGAASYGRVRPKLVFAGKGMVMKAHARSRFSIERVMSAIKTLEAMISPRRSDIEKDGVEMA